MACAQMVLSYLGIERDEEWLWRRLTVGSVTPLPQLSNLADPLGVVVEVHTGGRLEQFGPSYETLFANPIAVGGIRP